MRIEILGTPFNALGTPPDIENPADGLRHANLISILEASGHIVADLGDLAGFQCQDICDDETGINDFGMWPNLSREISLTLGAMLDRQAFPLLLGGDCRMLVGIFATFSQRETDAGLVFLDGHADFHSPETSPSGDPADMELAILTGRGPERITRIADKYPLLKDEEVVVYGIRAWDHIGRSNIEVYDRQRMFKAGIEHAVKEGLKDFYQKELPVWLHFDVDLLDPKLMPVMFPEPQGLTFEEVQEFLGFVWASCRVIGMSIACYHSPIMGSDGRFSGIIAFVEDVTELKLAEETIIASDEFAVVLPGIEPDQAMEQTQKIQAQIKNSLFLQDQGYEVFIRSSFGIATFPYHADNMTELLAKADHALFSAKGSGKDRIKSTNLSDPMPSLNMDV